MCIKNYVGYHCGHRDPEGTEMKTDYCRRPWRYEHEPACVFKYCLHLRVDKRRPRDSDFCPTCRAVRAALWKEWADKYVGWEKEGIMPKRDQLVMHSRIQDAFKDVEELSNRAVFLQGPEHTVQTQYRERLNQIVQPVEQQVVRLRAANAEWKLKMTLAERDAKASLAALNVLEKSRQRLVALTRPVAWSVNIFVERQEQLLEQLKAEEEKFQYEERSLVLYGTIN
ncbi:hypothetical protein PG985_001279 [Apiospora marii]|uniref:Uncharacterized protein n=1 Tax=Apiospora marii TaxID=335849 RepID=A0ABR1RHF6_9PEZI